MVETKDENSEVEVTATGHAFLAVSLLLRLGISSAWQGGAVTTSMETCPIRLRERHTNYLFGSSV